MNAADKEKRDQDTHDMVRALHTAITGVNGKGGLIDTVKSLSKSHYRLKQSFWMLVGILAGSGIIASGINLLVG